MSVPGGEGGFFFIITIDDAGRAVFVFDLPVQHEYMETNAISAEVVSIFQW
jgi:hypothetical protein